MGTVWRNFGSYHFVDQYYADVNFWLCALYFVLGTCWCPVLPLAGVVKSCAQCSWRRVWWCICDFQTNDIQYCCDLPEWLVKALSFCRRPELCVWHYPLHLTRFLRDIVLVKSSYSSYSSLIVTLEMYPAISCALLFAALQGQKNVLSSCQMWTTHALCDFSECAHFDECPTFSLLLFYSITASVIMVISKWFQWNLNVKFSNIIGMKFPIPINSLEILKWTLFAWNF